jgi:GT2 family glycosyltransferase
VNYNVAYFLEQCLNSVYKALTNINGEVFVIDNNSIDNSVEMVKNKFPETVIIENKENVGFSRANNQGIEISKGKYVLLLNPDTVVEEDTFQKVIDFMNTHPEAGGLGVHMVDGSGTFLPESKRGLPTPSVAFYKIFGLSKLFPKSRKFGKYHLGYLSEFETNEIDILSGAFMLMRRETLEKVGLLDETFFMYGEDIDLSYRIQLGGYKNYYFADTNIIHYKGESTKKSSVNYVFVFYRAMVIFAEKHFSKNNAKLFSFLINFAIYLRAGAAILVRFIQKSILPLFDFTFVILILSGLSIIWKNKGILFPVDVIKYAFPAYSATWLLSLKYSGTYDYPVKLINILKGTFFGTLIILVIYALLPKEYQFSRLFILLGTTSTLFYFILSRFILSKSVSKRYSINGDKPKSFAIVGSNEESKRIVEILKQSSQNTNKIHFVSAGDFKNNEQVGTINQLDQIQTIYKIDEIIFCAKDTSSQTIIFWMNKLAQTKTLFKIAQPDSSYLIGSNSSDTNGEYYTIDNQKITQPNSIRNKRTLDVIFAVLLIITSPILIFFFKSKKQFITNVFSCLISKKTFVSFSKLDNLEKSQLPFLKSGIFNPRDLKENSSIPSLKSNLLYAKNYSFLTDIEIIFKNWKKLDQN